MGGEMSDQIQEKPHIVSQEQLSKMSDQEIIKYFQEHPEASIELPDDFWENATWEFDKDDPEKVVSVGGPLSLKKVEK